MQSSLAQLLSLAPPPDKPIFAGAVSDWTRVEQDIGTTLPEDYKQLVNLYGVGSFADHVCLLNPFVPKSGFNARFGLQEGINALHILEPFQKEDPESFAPFPIYPVTGGLLAWAKECQNGGMHCWLTEGEPETWPTIVLDYDWSAEYYEFATSASGFLVGWFTGAIKISHYPPPPMLPPLFQPFAASSG